MEIENYIVQAEELNEILRVVYAHAVQMEHPSSACPCRICLELFP